MPRMIIVVVCVPALPSVPINSGMKSDRATTVSNSTVKIRITVPVSVPVKKSNNNQPIRLPAILNSGVSR